jgi:hypothetical protein
MVAIPVLAGLKRAFWTFGPLLVLSMRQTRMEGLEDAEDASVSFEPSSAAQRELEVAVDQKSRKQVPVLRPRPPPISVHVVLKLLQY